MPISTRGLHPEVRLRADWALGWAAHYNVPVTVTSTRRTWEEQQRLRTRWEQGKSKFPANKPGDSAHQWGLAWDSVTEPEYQAWWNEVRRLAGFEVLSHDRIHAQVPNWRQYVQRR